MPQQLSTSVAVVGIELFGIAQNGVTAFRVRCLYSSSAIGVAPLERD